LGRPKILLGGSPNPLEFHGVISPTYPAKNLRKSGLAKLSQDQVAEAFLKPVQELHLYLLEKLELASFLTSLQTSPMLSLACPSRNADQ
jgi:hypothetical protein